MIPFNKPHLTGKETSYIQDAVYSGKISGNGKYTRLCQDYLQKRYRFGKCLLTTSCTDALEMAALLIDIKAGDEVIIPSYTFVSTANAFVLRGAHIVFADSRMDHPGLDEDGLEELITPRTKAIVAVHYGGMACNMDKIMELANKHDLFVVEDAAHAIDSYYKGKDGKKRALGSIGHLATFSFHETKNIISGEGGLLVINHEEFKDRAEIIWEKGTNRLSFFRGEIDKYEWMDMGSSFLPSEIIAAFLYAQLQKLNVIQNKRKKIWSTYFQALSKWSENMGIGLPKVPDSATNNAHLFYLICRDKEQRDELIRFLKKNGVLAIFHYQSLHKSAFYSEKYKGKELRQSDRYSDVLIRLPIFYDLSDRDLQYVINTVASFNG